MANIAVLLRDGPHTSASTRYALKCTDFSVQITKTPIQIPIPQQSPQLIDIGVFRPSLTITGLVDNGAVNTNYQGSYANYEGMELIEHSDAPIAATGTTNEAWYALPYKNKLEEVAYKWIASEDQDLELEIGDATFPVFTAHTHGSAHKHFATGGGIYKVAIQQCRFQLNAAKEDRWEFTMQFVCKARDGVDFS